MKFPEMIEKYAELAVKIGVNLQKDQTLVINSPIECKELAREITKCAYKQGARYVYVNWTDQYINKEFYLYGKDEALEDVPNFLVDFYQYVIDKNAAVISITSLVPGIMKDVDGAKMMINRKAISSKTKFYSDYMMSNGCQWLVVAAPNKEWAKKVFPSENEDVAFDKLWEAILWASKVKSDNDPIKDWEEHIKRLEKYNKILNDNDFEYLEFKNSLGTDLKVGLVEGHIWCGGAEASRKGVVFSANIPSEEVFTMPNSHKVDGKVVSTMPLDYQGKLIEDFYLVFENGKVVDYDAKKEKEALKNLLELDEGSSRLGEVALISYDSPISNMGILFYNTLFDENASCHLALGNAYVSNIKDFESYSLDELVEKGYNVSNAHVDFMFGSSDMEIIGTKKNGEKIKVFEKGNFVF